MSGKIIITTPFPTPEEVAAFYKIPAKRVAELNRMIAEMREEDSSRSRRKKTPTRSGTRQRANGSKDSRSKK